MSKEKKESKIVPDIAVEFLPTLSLKEVVVDIPAIDLRSYVLDRLNIHLPALVLEEALTYIGSDKDKADKVIKYANVIGIQGVKQILH